MFRPRWRDRALLAESGRIAWAIVPAIDARVRLNTFVDIATLLYELV